MKSIYRQSYGFTTVETIVSLLISSLVLTALVSQFSKTTGWAYDQKIREAAFLQAQAILQTIGTEIRSLGNGVPFGQPNCQIGEDTFTDVTVTYPIIIASATTTTLPFRANEYGNIYVLTANLDPAVSNDITVNDIGTVKVGDVIYLNNSSLAANDCLHGTVASINTGTKVITLAAGKVYSPSALFNAGSTLQEVPTITYANNSGGITRTSGSDTASMGPGSSFVLTYQDTDAATITPPLTETVMTETLRQINVAVTVVSSKKLRTGGFFSATLNHTFAIRNFVYVF